MSNKTKNSRIRYRVTKRRTALELKETSQGVLLPVRAAEKTSYSHHNGVAKVNGGFADSAFADNKLRPIHRWVPWIAGFSSEFVRDAFGRYLPNNGKQAAMVLDPFCGVGTTLIEALRAEYNAVGFEINPYAALAPRAKCEAAAITSAWLPLHVEQYDSRK